MKKVKEIIGRLTAGSLRLAALFVAIGLAGSAWAATPVAVWDGASSDYNFTQLTRNGYTLGNIGGDYMNTVADGGSYLQIGSQNAKKAIVLSKEDGTNIGYCTVIIKFSDMPADGGSNRALITFPNGDNNSFIGVAQEKNLTRTSSFIWNNDIWNNNANVRTANVFDENEHTAALAYEYDHGSAFYIDGVARGTAAALKSNGYSIPSVTIGGVHYDSSTKFYSLPGMKVKAVALFSGWVSADDVANYVFPSDAASVYTATATEDAAWADLTWNKTLPEDLSEATIQLTIESGVTVTAPATLTVKNLTVTGAGTLTFAEGENTLSANAGAIGAKVALASGVTLKTSGTLSLGSGSNAFASGSVFEVVSGITYINAAECGLSGNIIIDAGATLENMRTDSLNWSGAMTVDVYGTLAMGNTRWSIPGGDCRFNLYAGSAVTGVGDGAAGLDFIGNRAMDLYGTDGGGTVTVAGPVRIRQGSTRIWIAGGMTLKLAGGIHDTGHSASFYQIGAGTLELCNHSDALGTTSAMTQGTLVLNNTSVAVPVDMQGTSTLSVTATAANKTVPVDATLASGASFTFSGSGKASGSLTFAAEPASTVQTFLQNNWTGTATLNYAITGESGGTAFKACLYGNADSTVVLGQGATNIFFANDAGNGPGVGTKLYFKGNVSIKNGWAYDLNYDASERTKETVFPELGADEGVTFTTRQDGNRTTFFRINTLKNFAGTIDVRAKTDVLIGNVVRDAIPAANDCVVKATKTDETTSVISGSVTVGESTVNLLYGTVGVVSGLYVPLTVSVPSVDNATVVVTVGDATIGTSAGNYNVVYGSDVTVTYTAAEGYVFGDNVATKTVSFDDVSENKAVTTEAVGTTSAVVAKIMPDGTPYSSSVEAAVSAAYNDMLAGTVYVQVIDDTDVANVYGALGIGYDATAKKFAKAVAAIDNAGYLTAQEALDVATSGATVILKDNTSEALTLANGKTVTIKAKQGSTTYTYTAPVAEDDTYTVDAADAVDGDNNPIAGAKTYTARNWYSWAVTVVAPNATVTGVGETVSEAKPTVQFTVTAAADYKVTSVTVGEDTVVADGEGKYSYKFDGPATITVATALDEVTFTLPVVTGAKVVGVTGGTWDKVNGTITAIVGHTVTLTWDADGAYVVSGTKSQAISVTDGMTTAPAPAAEVVTPTAAVAQDDTGTYYGSFEGALGYLYVQFNQLSNDGAYVDVIDGSDNGNAYAAYDIGYDAASKRYAKAVALIDLEGNYDPGYLTVQAALDAAENGALVRIKANNSEALTLANGNSVTINAKKGDVIYDYNAPVAAGDYTVDAGETVEGVTTYTARDWYTWTLELDTHPNATVTGLPAAVSEGDAVADRTVSFTVTADATYKVTAVKVDGVAQVGNNGTYTYTVSGDATVTVETELDVKTFTVVVPANTVVTVDGQPYTAGDEITRTIGTEVEITYAPTGAYVGESKTQTITVAGNTESVSAPAEYVIVPAVAQVGSTYFATFAEAMAAAQDGDTVTLLAPLALSSTVTLDKSVTLDLNGNNVTATDCRAFHVTAGAFE
ncbi:MAG: hypothetical protein IKO64_03200, partial [Kiritimatiellae bacterium]|nr:hypothetical protein [Kiritimatiellia bacterium]